MSGGTIQQAGHASGTSYSVVLDGSSHFEFDEEGKNLIIQGVETLNHNSIRFVASGIKPFEGGFGLLEEDWHDGGGNYCFLSSLDQINGLQSINVVFEGNASNQLYLEWTNTNGDSTQSVYSKAVSLSYSGKDIPFSNSPNYFKLYSDTGDIKISRITINYSCAGAETDWLGYLGVEDNGSGATINRYTPLSAGTRAIVFPNDYHGKPVTSISAGIFKNCMDVNVLIFPTNPEFTTIPRDFYSTRWGTRVRRIILSDNIKEIGANAFDAEGLYTEVFIPASVVSIGNRAFTKSSVTFRCEATSQPKGWDSNWYSGQNITVEWGATR